jgi:hypothetical protein
MSTAPLLKASGFLLPERAKMAASDKHSLYALGSTGRIRLAFTFIEATKMASNL